MPSALNPAGTSIVLINFMVLTSNIEGWGWSLVKTGHGFTSDHPQPSMFDVKTMKLIKTIEVPAGFSADGIYCDTSNDRVYIGSHPTKALMVVDARDGTVLGNIDLGGVPEQTVADGKGIVYQVLQDRPGGVAVVDVKTMKVTKTYPLGDNGGGEVVGAGVSK